MASEDPDYQVVDWRCLVRSSLEPVRDDTELLHKLRMTWVIRERVDALLGFNTVGAQGLLDVEAVLLCKREVRKHLAESSCACLFGNLIIARCANKHQ